MNPLFRSGYHIIGLPSGGQVLEMRTVEIVEGVEWNGDQFVGCRDLSTGFVTRYHSSEIRSSTPVSADEAEAFLSVAGALSFSPRFYEHLALAKNLVEMKKRPVA